jgi:hypothetical protein
MNLGAALATLSLLAGVIVETLAFRITASRAAYMHAQRLAEAIEAHGTRQFFTS